MSIVEISSEQSKRIKYIQKLLSKSRFRHEENAYVVEGPRVISEVPIERIKTIITTDMTKVEETPLKVFDGEILLLTEALFKTLSTDKTPQKIAAIVEARPMTIEKMFLKAKGLYVAMDRVQDPGNLGTMIRVADAAGFAGVLLSKDTVDLYHPKVLKAAMGSIEHLECVQVENLGETLLDMKREHIQICGAYLTGAVDYDSPDYHKKTCFVIGNEGQGISDQIIQLVDYRVKIPIYGQAESLNAAMACGILCYEAMRQRK